MDTTCWTTTPSIQAWLTAQGLTADQAYMYFVERAAGIVFAMGHQVRNQPCACGSL